MSKNKHDRRRILRSIVIGGGIAATVPKTWVKPVVDSVILPSHAQVSPPPGPSGPTTVNYSEDMAIPPDFRGATGPFVFNYDVTGITPTSDGTLDITDLIADMNDANENIAVSIEGTPIGTYFGGGGDNDCPIPNSAQLTIPLATLITAAADGTISVTLTPSAAAGFGNGSCIPSSGTLTLAFTGTTP